MGEQRSLHMFTKLEAHHSHSNFYFVLSAYIPHVCLVPLEARKGHQIPWNWTDQWLWATMGMLRIEPRSSLWTSVLNCWTISSAPAFSVFFCLFVVLFIRLFEQALTVELRLNWDLWKRFSSLPYHYLGCLSLRFLRKFKEEIHLLFSHFHLFFVFKV